jgi:hypothetical protein
LTWFFFFIAFPPFNMRLVWELNFMILSSLLSINLSRSHKVIDLVWFWLKSDDEKLSCSVLSEDVFFKDSTIWWLRQTLVKFFLYFLYCFLFNFVIHHFICWELIYIFFNFYAIILFLFNFYHWDVLEIL